MKKHITLSVFMLLFMQSFSQNLKGTILDKNNPEDNLGVLGANIYWLNTSVGTTTNEKGQFELPYKANYKKLVISFVGYKTDTIEIKDLTPIRHFITEANIIIPHQS